MKKTYCIVLISFFALTLLAGCGKTEAVAPDYKAAKGEGEPIEIRWDFGKPLVYNYSFDQETIQNAASFMGGQLKKSHAKGDCTITCEGDSKAEFQVMNLRAENSIQGQPDKKKTKESLPDVTLKGLREDGSFSGKDATQDFLMKTIFKLPEEPIAIGGTEVIDLETSFHVNNNSGKLRGKKATTFVGYYEIYGVNCIHLEMKSEYYEFESEDGKKSGSDQIKLKGSSSLYFDPEAKRIHRTVAECDIKFDMGLASINQDVKVTLHRM